MMTRITTTCVKNGELKLSGWPGLNNYNAKRSMTRFEDLVLLLLPIIPG